MRKVITLALLVLSVFAISSTASAATYYCPQHTSIRMTVYSTVSATCTSEGYKLYTCGRCGSNIKYKREQTPALGHDYVENAGSQEPSCVGLWHYIATCSRCSDYVSELRSPIPHENVFDSYVRPDCINDGSFIYRCNICDTLSYSSDNGSALGHVYSSVASASVEPTCTEPGHDTFDCRYCSESMEKVTDPALGHNYSILLERVEPTLTEEGSATYQCSRCDAQTVEVIPIPDTHTHTWKEIDRVDPTKDEPGSVAYSCTCGEILTEVIEYASPVHDTTQALGKSILSNVWGLFSIHVPGFSFTFGQMYLGIILCSVSLLIAKMFFGIGGGGQSTRTGSTNNPKISKDRRNDEF